MLIIFILSGQSLEYPIIKNNYMEYILDILYKSGFDSTYLLIIILLSSTNLDSKKGFRIAFMFLANKKTRAILENYCFCQVIWKYSLEIINR